jgi:Asp-tRNA(Asn)/Glu-tRNA(Gln) amidotransferase A subunit family amidase
MKNRYRLFVFAAACLGCLLLGMGIARREALSTSDVLLASRIIGLDFSQAERDSMLGNLTEYRNNYDSLRKQSLPNEVAPAMVFSPLPVGYYPAQGADKMVYSPLPKVALPADSNTLAFMPVRQLAELIRTRQITSVQLTRFYLNRLKKFTPTLNCVVTLTEDTALAQAARADAEIRAGKYRGPLHGMPYGAKDLFAAKGYATTWGAQPYRKQVLNEDAAVIQKLRAAGAVLCAKLTLGELAMGDGWFGGKTRNPWDATQGSSGSSAGSASAVSAGLLPFALGTETLGSIVSPSTVCGTTGLRPTFGRVSRAGAMALSWSMDKAGPICRDVEDAVLVLAAIHGKDVKDAATIPAQLTYNYNKPLSGLRIGYAKRAFERKYGFRVQDSVALAVLRKLGAQLIPIELPRTPNITYLLLAEGAAAFDELTRSHQDSLLAQQNKNAWPNLFRSARFVPAVEYIQAQRVRTQLITQMDQLMQTVDVYVAPSWSGNLTLTNLTGHPCIVVPAGFTDKGLPTSISFTGRLFDEGTLAVVARAYQNATDWHLRRPSMALR